MIWSESKLIPQFTKDKNNLDILRSMNPLERREYLIINNIRLAISIAQKFSFEEDYESVAMIGLIKAVDTFNLDKDIQFATYASMVIRNEILMYIRKTKKHSSNISFETIIHSDPDGNPLTLGDVLENKDDFLDNVEKKEELTELYKAINSLSDRDRKIICLLYGIDTKPYTQKEVGDILKVSQSYVSRLEKNILMKMKKKLKNYR
ncbi:sigma-70 family RNA polymerase sigma factor [Lacrimispora sp.]|uniref:sigma-70 family RNA polymerase sigma factor n=1 Tax=Lacrimispora sp. TaxID=2719234 RepID=UPI003460A951